jgi:UDP-N-acetylmuramate dehydrogenase
MDVLGQIERTASERTDRRTLPTEALERRLRALTAGAVRRDVDLRPLSWWRIGGRARLLVEPAAAAEVAPCLGLLMEAGVPSLVIGDGSNLLFDDEGFDGVILRIGRRLGAMRTDGRRVVAEAGLWVPSFVRRLGHRGLSGLEHAIGIPGTLGGLVAMNGGSQRKNIGSVITRVRGCGLDGRPFERTHAECRFRYRGSTLQDDRLIVLETELELRPGDPAAMRREMLAILVERSRKFPRKLPNCGSVFLSNPAMYDVVGPPGAAIERAGLKGLRVGGAQISPIHANFIVNCGGARSDDVLRLVHRARSAVLEATGFAMDCEVRHVAPDGVVLPAHVAAEQRFS